MERSKNLTITIEPARVIKSSDGEYRLNQRLQREYAALGHVRTYLPDKVPTILEFTDDGNGLSIAMEKLELASNVSFNSITQLIEAFQTLPTDCDLPTYSPDDYIKNAEAKLRFLNRIGAFKGLTDVEVGKIRHAYVTLSPALGAFKTVFVHGDIQTRHFATKGNELAIFDFDQAHFGSELEDWAFLSIRHPLFESETIEHLKQKFSGNHEQAEKLDAAFLLMQIDKLLHGYFSRTYQWRGKLFDIAAKVYGRKRLRDLTNRLSPLGNPSSYA